MKSGEIMGKILRKSKKAVSKCVASERVSFRQLVMSVISLIIAAVVLATTTFSWFSIKTSNVEAGIFTLDCGKGLRVNDSGTSELTFSQVNNKYLIPASSVDGRNLFFPADGSDFSKTTSTMTFRSANAGDKNVNYIQIDFTLTAQQNHTALYINDEKTSIRTRTNDGHTVTDWSIAQAAPLRAALWSSTAEDGVPNTPIVFNPSASTMRTAAVAEVDRSTGAYISDGRQVAHAFSDYSFGGEPVATLSKDVETHFSYIIWLEGCDPKCTDKVLGRDIEINLAFSTSWDKTQTIRFKDESSNHWITDLMEGDHYSLSLHYAEVDSNNQETGSNTDFNMYKYIENVDGEWTCNIPGDMRNKISFILRPGSNSADSNTYKFCVNSKEVNQDVADATAFGNLTTAQTTFNRGSNRQYIVDVARNSSYPAGCRGYWKAIGDSDGSGHDDGGDIDGDDF